MDCASSCIVCQSPATQKCAGCRNVFYCSRAHQKEAWKKHKAICKPFKVSENPTLGRYLTATRFIGAGEIILQEQPLVWGPSQITPPVCLSCYKLLRQFTSVPCRACGWPMCSEKCRLAHVEQPECIYTQQKGQQVSIKEFLLPHPSYQCLTVLRMLYQRDHNKDVWDKLMKLQDHSEERKQTEKYESDRIAVAQFIRQFFKLEQTFTEEDIMKVCGILQVNGHEIPLTEPPYVAIYEEASMLEHNCQANCYKSFTSTGEILIIAGVPIKSGDNLSICYTDSLWGTANRQHYLQETKFFSCTCARCSDPTEFGTCFSALKCQDKSCQGFVLPSTFLQGFEQPWSCGKCGKSLSANSAQDIVDRIGRDLDAMQKGDPKSCKIFLDYYEKILHSNHYYLTDVKLALGQLIGQDIENGLNSTLEEDLELKIKVCTEVTELVKILNAAEVRVRGTMLFELHAALAEIAKRQINSGKILPNDLRPVLIKSKTILEEAIELLQHEPEELPEGKIATQAKKNLNEMENVLKKIDGVLQP